MPVSTLSPAVVDWRSINERQWATGIRATLGVDGEPLQCSSTLHLSSQPVLEDHTEVMFEG